MASGTVMTHLAYLNNLAQNSKAPAVYTGNNPYNAQYEKPESETDKQLAKLKMKTEAARAKSLEAGSLLAQQKFNMSKAQHDLEMQTKLAAIQTQKDLANNIDASLYSPDVKIRGDVETENEYNTREYTAADGNILQQEMDDLRKKQGYNPLDDKQKSFVDGITAIREDPKYKTENDKIGATMALAKDLGYIPIDKNGKAIDDWETIGDFAEDAVFGILDPVANTISSMGNLFRSKEEAEAKNAEWEQYNKYQDEYAGTQHKSNVYNTFRKLEKQREKNKLIEENVDKYAQKRIKELGKQVTQKVKIKEKDKLRPRDEVERDLKTSTGQALRKIQRMNITPAAKVALSKEVLTAHKEKMAEWSAQQGAQVKALEELRKAKLDMQKERDKIAAQTTKEIAVNSQKGNSKEAQAKLRKLDLEIKKLEKEMKKSKGMFSFFS